MPFGRLNHWRICAPVSPMNRPGAAARSVGAQVSAMTASGTAKGWRFSRASAARQRRPWLDSLERRRWAPNQSKHSNSRKMPVEARTAQPAPAIRDSMQRLIPPIASWALSVRS